MEEGRNELDPFIDTLISYIKSDGGYIRSHDTLFLCDLVERSRFVIKKAYYAVYALALHHMKNTESLLDRHKQGACFMLAIMDGLCIPKDLGHLEVYRDLLAVWAGVCMMTTLFAAKEGKALSQNGKIEFPAKICELNDYRDGLEYRLGVACETDVDRGILTLFLASELFFIESYNRSLVTQRL